MACCKASRVPAFRTLRREQGAIESFLSVIGTFTPMPHCAGIEREAAFRSSE
jgi:hypothetical protein